MTIAILFGSVSFEHEISIVSAISMKKVLKEKLLYIFIDKNREFYLIPTEKIKSNLFSSGEYKKFDQLQLTNNGFIKKSLFGTKFIDFDVVLNLVHGGDGEDGVLAGLFKFYNIPFIGPRVEAGVISCDKYITKSYSANCDVKTLPCQYFDKTSDIKIEKYPCIIKPTKLGSSIGVSVVKNEDELAYALDIAFEYDDTIIAEPFINGVKEYNLAGTKVDGKFYFSIVEEPEKDEFLDFDKKYLDFNRTQKVSCADLSDKMIEKLQENFIKIYNNTFNGSLIRCDFFVIENDIYLNEINSIPGSMANYLFDDFNDLIVKLSQSLPTNKKININYEYVNKIQSAKGKV
ncbi:MAG: D-alanine--D-alanine ligase [Epsilonproteobacteria bacterium]|nr:MAG: D-alanine--D-alanine ligase [Campylobacterota bacterium]